MGAFRNSNTLDSGLRYGGNVRLIRGAVIQTREKIMKKISKDIKIGPFATKLAFFPHDSSQYVEQLYYDLTWEID